MGSGVASQVNFYLNSNRIIIKVIPLKLFHYQTLFLKLGIINIHDINIKKCNKKIGSPCLFTRQQALKLGYFYRLSVKNSNHLLTELTFCYLKHTKFYLEHNSSFIYSFVVLVLLWVLFVSEIFVSPISEFEQHMNSSNPRPNTGSSMQLESR